MKRIIAAILLASASPLFAQTVAITGGTVALGDGSEPIRGGTVVIRNGRIVDAGYQVGIPDGATMIDARGKWVTPGIVAGFSQLGLADVGAVDASNDTSASSGPFSAAIDVAPAINPKNLFVEVSRSDGVTRAIVAPGTAKSIFAGQGALIDLGADWDAVTRPRLFQYVALGEDGGDAAGGSRASAHVLLRNALREAAELSRYAAPLRSGTASQPAVPENPNDPKLLAPSSGRSDDVLLTRFDAAALVPVLRGQQILMVNANRASDILQVIALGKEFSKLRLVLVGADEGWIVADRIAASGIPVIAAALMDLPSRFESLGATQSNIGRMRAAGVNVSIGMINGDQPRLSRQHAGNLVALGRVPGASGLSWGEALAMVTSRPAEALGLGRDIGSLAPGRRGDVVIWSGDPLENSSAAEAVWIDGVPQPLDNHQTKLRDRYKDLSRRELPEVYRR